jgi:hypothetical protein
MSDNRSTIAFPATNPLPPGRRGVSVRCSYPLSLPGFRFNAEAGEMVAFIAPELAMLDAVGNALFHASQFDQRAPETIDIERMLEVWGSERPVVVFRNEIRHNVANPVEAESLAYAKAMAVPQISADAEDLVCRLTGVPATSLREMYGASESSPDAWRVSLARLLLMSKPARHGVLIVEESPHTRDIIDVLLAARPWIQPTVIVLSADAAACIKANRRLYVSLVKELDEYQVVPLNGAITSMLANIPRDGFFSSTRCPCGDSLEANEAKLRRCARCNSDALGGWECTACPYGVCIRCLDSERFVEARVAEGRDDSYTLAMSAPAAVQLVVPDVVGLVLRFACSTVPRRIRPAACADRGGKGCWRTRSCGRCSSRGVGRIDGCHAARRARCTARGYSRSYERWAVTLSKTTVSHEVQRRYRRRRHSPTRYSHPSRNASSPSSAR